MWQLLAIILIFLTRFDRISSTEITVHLKLKCDKPYSQNATVFLMEEDSVLFGDEDDVLDYKTYTFKHERSISKDPKSLNSLILSGTEWEIGGLTPFLFVNYNCASKKDNRLGWRIYQVTLESNVLFSNTYYVYIDLDEEKANIEKDTLTALELLKNIANSK